MKTRTPARKGTRKPAAQPAPVADAPNPVLAELREAVKANPDKSFDEVSRDLFEDRLRRELRHNAFADLPPFMFEAVESVIHDDVTEAAGYFTGDGRIRENRLREVRNLLVRAAAVANILLEAGECGR